VSEQGLKQAAEIGAFFVIFSFAVDFRTCIKETIIWSDEWQKPYEITFLCEFSRAEASHDFFQVIVVVVD